MVSITGPGHTGSICALRRSWTYHRANQCENRLNSIEGLAMILLDTNVVGVDAFRA